MENKLTINQWAEEDRPREKMMNKGIDTLTDAELLAILIGSGNTEETAVGLMRRVLASCDNNLNVLGKQSVEELCRFKGIGVAKAVSIVAACELGKRRKLAALPERKEIRSSATIYQLMHPLMCDLPTEECWLLLANHSCKLIDKIRISSGGITETAVDVRIILREAIIRRASSIILCHNHPSGNLQPSPADNQVTERLKVSARVMDIHLLDHVIITDGGYYSYADEGIL